MLRAGDVANLVHSALASLSCLLARDSRVFRV